MKQLSHKFFQPKLLPTLMGNFHHIYILTNSTDLEMIKDKDVNP